MQQDQFGIREREHQFLNNEGIGLKLTLTLHLGLEKEVKFLHVCLGSELMGMK
jgi:hypothetical protein